MTLKELNFFYKICEFKSITKVAHEENISQSAISFALQSLEKKLGEALFNRIGKKLVLNERGRRFYALTFSHYQNLLKAKDEFLSANLSGSINISASKTIANYLMPKVYFDFLSLHEEVSINTFTQNSTDIVRDIENGKLDLGLIESEISSHEIVKEKLRDDELIVVTSDRKQRSGVFIDSIDKKWILRESGSGTREIFLNALGSHEIKTFLSLNEFEEIKQVLKSNKNTISAISKLAVTKELEEKSLHEIKLKNIELKRSFYMIYHKNHLKNRLFNEFIGFLKTHIKS